MIKVHYFWVTFSLYCCLVTSNLTLCYLLEEIEFRHLSRTHPAFLSSSLGRFSFTASNKNIFFLLNFYILNFTLTIYRYCLVNKIKKQNDICHYKILSLKEMTHVKHCNYHYGHNKTDKINEL